MVSSTYTIINRLFLFLAVVFALSACSGNSGSFPQIASPPPFDYVDGAELRSRMHQLAFELQQLDLALLTEDDNRPDFQREVVDSLQNIERIAGVIQSGDLSSRHQFLQDDMDGFLASVRSARMSASMNNPRYYMAGRVAGSCVNCHRSAR